tara:strand:+ start:61 stop:297 length:237 start_codon:yes stop_codon:yes gene_type:complete
MKARNIEDLENIILKNENQNFKEKIIKNENAYYNKNYYGYGGHILYFKGKTWNYFYNYLYINLYENKKKLLNYFNNDK